MPDILDAVPGLSEAAPPTPVAGAGDILRLLGSGAGGPVLVALSRSPLRTKKLTERLPEFSPRTIYRYGARLADLELVERREVPGIPSSVIYRLSDPAGRQLFHLLERFAQASGQTLVDQPTNPRFWSLVGLLADLWDLGIVEELTCEPRSATELSSGPHGLTYHQATRRARRFAAAGLIAPVCGRGRHARFGLSEGGRKGIALIAGVSRWRARYLIRNGSEGLARADAATALLAALPLVELPGHGGRVVRLEVRSSEREEAIWAKVARNGAVTCGKGGAAGAEGWARGRVATWLAAVVDGNRGRMSVGGDVELVDACLRQLHDALWEARTKGSV